MTSYFIFWTAMFVSSMYFSGIQGKQQDIFGSYYSRNNIIIHVLYI